MRPQAYHPLSTPTEEDEDNYQQQPATPSSPCTSPLFTPEVAVIHVDDDSDDSEDEEHVPPLKTPVVNPSPADGVFTNISAKPDVPAAAQEPQSAPEMPPSYDAVINDPTPTYWDTTIYTSMSAQDDLDNPSDILIEGLPVGSFVTFVLTAMVSVAFQFVGFLMTFLLATSHAGRAGAKTGFGLTLLQYGISLRNRVDMIEDNDFPFAQDNDLSASLPQDATPEEKLMILDRTEWVAYLLMLTGWFLIIKSMFEYLRAKKLKALVLASPEALVV